ncbi:GNAT family N-acetyltransferase [Sandaracinus amylolyticus]|uniref:Histone acetyltransferase HPA2 n=1 Tax=Sandaracinus amylolyticus TaxID=927083 RepID=A0A0F6WAH4_9BACT|nr:GNAT family N-acetyltransferase [Sandaracinus amylolyticus]AKF11502.1 Histone acetyltransferase HPA2 [Sandaracinus amylolyticus]
MRIRTELRPTDREAIARIVRAVGVFRPDEVDVAMELVDEGLSTNADQYFFAVAEDDHGAVLGYACWGHAPMTDATYDLYWIAVDPTRHGGGIGQKLLAACEDDVRARGGRLLLIETEGTPDYEPTRRFYLRAGYPEIARVRDYYRVGADKIVYGRSLA